MCLNKRFGGTGRFVEVATLERQLFRWSVCSKSISTKMATVVWWLPMHSALDPKPNLPHACVHN